MRRLRRFPVLSLLCYDFGFDDAQAAASLLELDCAGLVGKKSVVLAPSDVLTGEKFCAALAHEDGACGYDLSIVLFYAESLGVAVATISC